MSTSEKAARILKYASRLFKPGELVEYRAKVADGSMRGFYFNDLERLSEVVAMLDSDGRASVSYVCINPLRGRMAAERGLTVNPTDEQVAQIVSGPSGKTASNEDIDVLRWIFIDVDTVRVPHLRETDRKKFDEMQHECATEEEKAASREVALRVVAYLRQEKGWPQPIIADSGNGWHILFRMDLQNTATNYHNHADVLKVLKGRFDCAAAQIDSTVYNPARLTRAYGSTTRKGADTPERPWRPNGMFPSKEPVGTVTLDQILSLVVEAPGFAKGGGGDLPELAEGFDPYDFIDHYEKQGAFEIAGEKEWQGNPILATDYCLFQGKKHSGDEYKSGFIIGDSFGYKCFSDDCEGLTVMDVIRILGEAKNEDGTKKYIPYDKPIFEMDRVAVQQTFDRMLADGDIVQASASEAEAEKREDEKLDKAMEAPKPAPQTRPERPAGAAEKVSGTVGGTDLPAWDKGSEALDDLGIKVSDLASDLISVILHHPGDVWQDGFVFYMKRIKTKLGFDRKDKKPEGGEAQQQTLRMPVGEAMRLVIRFAELHKRLPDKAAFDQFLDVSTDPDVMKNAYRGEVRKWAAKLKEKPASIFDVTANALVDKLDLRAEIDAWRTAFNHFLLREHDISGARMILRKHFNVSTTQDTPFEQGTWQERTDAIYADFEKNILGVGDGRKFKLGFKSIDNSGMNIGLDGDHCICICGPASNRKTTAALSIAMNFAIQGKNVLFFAGEHQCMKVLKRLTLQLSHFFKDDPEIGDIPGLSKWEGLNRTAGPEDLAKIKALLLRLKARDDVPGFIEPQNIGAVTRGEEDKLGALLQYAEATFPKYQWDCIIIDPLDSIMPPEVAGNSSGPSNWKICSGIVDRLFDFSRNAFGGKQCMVIVTAQFKTDARRDIEKIQEKNAGVENFDDELESILKRDGLIQYFTTIGQRFDLCLGVATRTKDGTEGLIVRGRDREGGVFNACYFHVDPDTNYMTEKKRGYQTLDKEQAKETAQSDSASQVIDPDLVEEAM